MKCCQQSQETTALIGAITLDELFSARWNSYYPQPSAAGCFHFLVVIACSNLWGKEVKGAGGKKQLGAPATIPESVTEWTYWYFFSFSDWSYKVFQSYMISFTIYPKRIFKKKDEKDPFSRFQRKRGCFNGGIVFETDSVTGQRSSDSSPLRVNLFCVLLIQDSLEHHYSWRFSWFVLWFFNRNWRV